MSDVRLKGCLFSVVTVDQSHQWLVDMSLTSSLVILDETQFRLLLTWLTPTQPERHLVATLRVLFTLMCVCTCVRACFRKGQLELLPGFLLPGWCVMVSSYLQAFSSSLRHHLCDPLRLRWRLQVHWRPADPPGQQGHIHALTLMISLVGVGVRVRWG